MLGQNDITGILAIVAITLICIILVIYGIVNSITDAIERKRSNREEEERRRKQREIEKKRRNTPFVFDDIITYEVFNSCVLRAANENSRVIHVSTNGPIVKCKIVSQSGKTQWEAIIDYNDFGRFTGRFWIYGAEHSSSIPYNLAHQIVDTVNRTREQLMNKNMPYINTCYTVRTFCPHCGNRVDKNHRFCSACGRECV